VIPNSSYVENERPAFFAHRRSFFSEFNDEKSGFYSKYRDVFLDLVKKEVADFCSDAKDEVGN